MAYKDKHGITVILDTQINNLQVSRDDDMDFDTGEEFPIAVLLYTPSMKRTDTHYHIPLTVEEARALAKWLKKFVKEHE